MRECCGLSFKLLPGEDRSVLIVRTTHIILLLCFNFLFCGPHRIIVLCLFVSPYFGFGVCLYLLRQIRNVVYIGVSLGTGDVSRLSWISLLDISSELVQPEHNPTPSFSKIIFNVIVYLRLRLFDRNFVPSACCVSTPHSFIKHADVLRRVRGMKLPVKQFSSSSDYSFSPLDQVVYSVKKMCIEHLLISAYINEPKRFMSDIQ